LTYDNIKYANSYLSQFTLEERMEKLGLRPDRADVIIPASEIFLHIFEKLEQAFIYVPKIGLADGLVYMLYEKYHE